MANKFLAALLCFSILPVSAQLTCLEDTISLNEVVFSARRKNIDSRGLGNMRINMEQLKISPLFLGERDIIKTLQFLPGVSAGMEGSSQLNIRGGTNDQTLYLLDDVPVYNQSHTFGLFSIFNTDAIKSVDLYKGGIPTQYGDKLSGVVSVALKDGDFKQYHHSVSLGLLAGTFASEGPIIRDHLSYVFTGRRSFVDLLYKGFTTISGGQSGAMIAFYDINAKMTWKMNSANLLSWQLYSGYDDIYGMNTGRDRIRNERYFEKFGYGWKTFMTALRYSGNLTSSLQFIANLYHTSLTNFNRVTGKFIAPDIEYKKENVESSLMNEMGGKIAFEQKTGTNNSFFYGMEGANQIFVPDCVYKRENSSEILYNSGQLRLFKLSAYLYDEYRYKHWFASLGLRASLYDNWKKKKISVEPRVKINTFLGEKNKLMLAYDRMHQPIHTVYEMNYNFQADYWVPFQEEILPSANQASVGWKNFTNSNLSFSIEAYYKTMKNLLLIKNQENYIDFHTDYETGKGKSMGFECLLEYSRERFTGWISYTLSKSDRRFEDRTYPFKYDATHSFSTFVSYKLIHNEKTTHTFSLNSQANTGYPYYVPEISYPGLGLPTLSNAYPGNSNIYSVDYIPQYPNVRIRNFFRLDANYTLERPCKKGTLSWQFSLLNFTNRKNPYAIYKKDDKYKAFVLIPLFPSVAVKRFF